ncbi:MAG: hypothetical protein U1C49_01975 [Candidatus Andersenbacteria bacterium]|nr:hypothetical protein [bacterium]MDZ4225594.1 hypothetical protein [Candidatus Andersenbacteria bacterium]
MLIAAFGLFTVNYSRADISSCSVSVSPSVLNTNQTGTLVFAVNNTDAADVLWVKITSPSSEFSVTGGSASGWSVSVDGGAVTYTSGNLGAGESKSFSVNVQTGVYPTASASWTVQVSDVAGGSSPYSCSGDTGVAITGDATAPVLSGITAANVTQTTASIQWTTDEPATTVVQYGTTTAYGTTKRSNTLVTEHAMSVTGLTAGTIYHYKVQSADAVGNTSNSGDKVFTTPSGGGTPIPTSTVTPSVLPDSGNNGDGGGGGGDSSSGGDEPAGDEALSAPAAGNKSGGSSSGSAEQVPAPETEADRVAPTVYFTSQISGAYKEAPALAGAATDNISVRSVWYSIDDGRNWLLIKSARGLGTSKVSFAFAPDINIDDNYNLKLRAIDTSGNVGYSSTAVLVFDTMPPVVGTAMYSIGSQMLDVSASGYMSMMAGLDQKVVVSATGGVTAINMIARPVEKGGPEEIFALTRNGDTSLWSGIINLSSSGEYELVFRAEDGANNVTERVMRKIVARQGGKITNNSNPITGAQVVVWAKDELTGRFRRWNASPFRQQNPQLTDEQGGFRYVLPPNTYYLTVKARGYRPVQSQIFTVEKNVFIAPEIGLAALNYIKLGIVEVPAPPLFWPQTIPITIDNKALPINPETKPEAESVSVAETQVQGESGGVSLGALAVEGPAVITFLTSWSPQAGEQLTQLSRAVEIDGIRAATVLVQDTVGQADVLRHKGRYAVPVLADPVGAAAVSLGVESVPYHLLVMPGGEVVATKGGLMTTSQIREWVEGVNASKQLKTQSEKGKTTT